LTDPLPGKWHANASKTKGSEMDGDVGNKDEAVGRVKEAAGSLTDDEQLKKEGKVDRASGKAKRGLDRLTDRVKEALHRE
jgi:uncharacterized protein YjbJ (UPF0337 family)